MVGAIFGPFTMFCPRLSSLILCLIVTAAHARDIKPVLFDDVLHSDAMNKDVPYRVRVPGVYNSEPDRIFPVLYCLHGAGADREAWTVMPALLNAINGDYPAVIVSFNAENSGYRDNSSSSLYTTFFFDELVPFLEENFRIGREAGYRAVTGFSMGGQGAFHYMLEKPDFFSSVSALSGAFRSDQFGRISDDAAAGVELPPMYLGCGTLDSYLDSSRQMAALVPAEGYSLVYDETPDAAHNWAFWSVASLDVIKFHYQYFTEAADPLWRGMYPLSEDGKYVYTEDFLGTLYIEPDPWVYSYRLSRWLYLPAGDLGEGGQWIWVTK